MSVTVLMCAYHTPDFYLKTAVESILCQTHKDFRFMIILDGLEQNDIKNLLESYNDPRIEVFEKPNTGLTKSLNYGLGLIDTEFILRQDADDYSHPKRLETLLNSIDDDCGALGDNYAHVDGKGKVTKINTADPENVDPDRYAKFGMAGTIAGGGVLLRTKAVHDVGKWCYPVAQDCYMWHSMKSKGWRVSSVKETLYYWRHHDWQITVTRKLEQEHVVQQVLKEFEQ